jgi:hypothetical protein
MNERIDFVARWQEDIVVASSSPEMQALPYLLECLHGRQTAVP